MEPNKMPTAVEVTVLCAKNIARDYSKTTLQLVKKDYGLLPGQLMMEIVGHLPVEGGGGLIEFLQVGKKYRVRIEEVE